ncbi:synaptotagmin-11 isoform 1 [Corchorus olitorius]|uniref:Synaptotagmin-11 isoform 1 n=1 Tax=Corchorus olitorius TaxID=93759 RepID=A0A1R3GW54_9ROSI|nr:synaptotagmin-11 isoform 1 [Corchorus olitorius]
MELPPPPPQLDGDQSGDSFFVLPKDNSKTPLIPTLCILAVFALIGCLWWACRRNEKSEKSQSSKAEKSQSSKAEKSQSSKPEKSRSSKPESSTSQPPETDIV